MLIKYISDVLKERPERGNLGPAAPRPPTPGLHLPPGTHIPDWRKYKVEDIPELSEVQKKLAARGLKDPWLRNEVWRYDRKVWGTQRWRTWKIVTFGWRYGIPLFLITILLEATVLKKTDDHHSHH